MRKWVVQKDFCFAELQRLIVPTSKALIDSVMHEDDVILESENVKKLIVKGVSYVFDFTNAWKSFCTLTGEMPESPEGAEAFVEVDDEDSGQSVVVNTITFEGNGVTAVDTGNGSVKAVIPGGSLADVMQTGWNLSESNPVVPPYAYYCDFVFNENQPFVYSGTSYAYYLMAATASGGPNKVWFSNDFITWVGPVSTSLTTGYHVEVVYVPTDPKPLKCWLWSGAGVGFLTDHQFTQSADGITWDTPVLLTERSSGKFVRTGFCTGGYGMTCLHYNTSPTNTGDDPRNYKYWGTLNGQYVPTGKEAIFPCFSADGIAWELLPFSAFRPQADFPLATDATAYSNASWHPHVSWLDFDKIGDRYYGLCSSGRDGATATGMFLAESSDSIFWRPASYAPVSELGWSGDVYAMGPDYARYRSGTPCVWYERDGFGQFGPEDAKVLVMWQVQPTASSSSRSLAVAWHKLM